MSLKTYTALRTPSETDEIRLDVVIGDLIEASFKAPEDPDFFTKRFAAAKNRIGASYDPKTNFVSCKDAEVQRLLQVRVKDRVKVIGIGNVFTFSCPR